MKASIMYQETQYPLSKLNDHNSKPQLIMTFKKVKNGLLNISLKKLFKKTIKTNRTSINFIKHNSEIKAYGRRLDLSYEKDH